jgi:hypothetical protein
MLVGDTVSRQVLGAYFLHVNKVLTACLSAQADVYMPIMLQLVIPRLGNWKP